MALDHEAIYKAYAGTVRSIDDSTGAFDINGNSVTLCYELMEELELTDSVEIDKYALMERYHLVQGRNKTFLKPE